MLVSQAILFNFRWSDMTNIFKNLHSWQAHHQTVSLMWHSDIRGLGLDLQYLEYPNNSISIQITVILSKKSSFPWFSPTCIIPHHNPVFFCLYWSGTVSKSLYKTVCVLYNIYGRKCLSRVWKPPFQHEKRSPTDVQKEFSIISSTFQ